MITFKDLQEKKLTKAELKKREEIAKAIERDQPGMDMGKKMAIATAAAKRVAEDELEEGRFLKPKEEKAPKSLATVTLKQLIKNKKENPGQSPFKTQADKIKKYFGEDSDLHESEELAEGQTEDWAKIQAMDKGSLLTGKKEDARKRLEHLKAVRAHHKKYGNDLHKVNKEIERINRSRVAEDVDEAYVGAALSSANSNAEHARTASDKNSIKVSVDKVGGVKSHKAIKAHLKAKGIDKHIHSIGTSDNYNTVHLHSNTHSSAELHKLVKESEELDEGKHEGTIAAMAKSRYTPEPGHKIITKKGGQIPGTVEKLEKDYVYFRHPEGKLFRTHKDNVQLDRSVKESEDLEEALTYKQVHTSWVVEPKSRKEFNTPFKKEQEAEARAHAEKTGGKLRKVDQRGHIIKANAVHEVKAAEDMAGTSATCSKQKSSDLGKSGKKAPGNKNINLAEAMSAEEGPGKGAEFKDMSQEQHLECMKYHKDEYNAIKGKTHKYIKELDETGKTDSKLKYHAKMYHKHKEAV